MGNILNFTNPRCDEAYVGENKLSKPPLPEPATRPESFGPFAALIRQPPAYSVIYHGFPALDRLTTIQRAVYGYVRGWNENGKHCFASLPTIAKAVGACERATRSAVNDLCEMELLRKTPRTGKPSLLEARMDA